MEAPTSPSRTREGAALRREYSLDKLEAQEQDIIQHVRTAGLRKPRETALVDELLAMRKERRQIFSALLGHIVRLQSTRQELRDEVERHLVAHRELRNLHQQELKKLEETHASELLHQTQRLGRKYEEKLRLIGSKVDEVTSAKLKDQQSSVDAKAREMSEIAVAQVEKRYEEKLLRYKEALRAVAEKEKDMEAIANKQSSLARSFQREVQMLKLQAEEQRSLISDLLAKEKTANTLLESARSNLQSEQMDSGALRVEVSRLRDIAQAETRSLSEAHSEQLLLVEEKVKSAMQKKDSQIAKLKSDLRDAQNSRNNAEQILADLQRGLNIR